SCYCYCHISLINRLFTNKRQSCLVHIDRCLSLRLLGHPAYTIHLSLTNHLMSGDTLLRSRINLIIRTIFTFAFIQIANGEIAKSGTLLIGIASELITSRSIWIISKLADTLSGRTAHGAIVTVRLTVTRAVQWDDARGGIIADRISARTN